MNISTDPSPASHVSNLLSIIGQPVRVQILAVIAASPACVCHLEAVLGVRQASISQHLMVLRKAGVVSAHREGRNIFYHLEQPAIFEILQQAASLTLPQPDVLQALGNRPVEGCPCPQCNPGADPNLSCDHLPTRRKI